MNDLKIFDYNSKMVRTLEKDNEFWWVLKDVCKVLKISNHKEIAQRLDIDEVGRFNVPHPQNFEKEIEVICINESGLYNVILRSDKPEAKPFRKWVTSEVLPSIRKTGSYSMNQESNNVNNQVLEILKSQQEQFTKMFTLITAQLPQPYKPRYTRWMGKTYDKIDKLSEYNSITRKQMLRKFYTEFQDTYNIDLSEYQEEYCAQHNLHDIGIYTLNAIDADYKIKELFDLMLDTQIEQTELKLKEVV